MEIETIGLHALTEVTQFYALVTSDLRKKGIDQWDRFYPNRFVMKRDLKNGTLFGFNEEDQLIGAIVLNKDESKQYSELQWNDHSGRPLIIHRLAVHPTHQGKGLGKRLLNFAEEYALKKGYTSIRMDVYSQNPEAVGMYESAGYQVRGTIKFPFRKVPYYCFEKMIQNIDKREE
jgi:ribosomal protein S18 acetylase RimI-like enzyme